MVVLEIEDSILLAIGVLALSETFGRGVCARLAPPAGRAGWVVVCALLALTLGVVADVHSAALLVHMGVAVLASLFVHVAHVLRGAPGSPSFLAANAGVLIGTAPWIVATLLPSRDGDLVAYGAGLVYVLVLFIPSRWAWRRASRFIVARWPVREEVVGGSLWAYVRPRTVLLAFGIALTAIASLDPGMVGRVAAIAVGIVAGATLLYVVYRLAVRFGDPLREGRIWYRPRREDSFVLIDALAGAAIALTAITVACEAITTRQRMAADAALESAVREAVAEGMESAWAMSVGELAAAEGSVRTTLEPTHGFLNGELERAVVSEEKGVLWQIRVTVRWRTPSGADRSCTLESLRSEAGGRR